MRKLRKAGLCAGLCVLSIAFSGCGKKEASVPELQELSQYISVGEEEIPQYNFVGKKEIFIEDENLKSPKAMVCVGDSLYVVNKGGNSVLQYSKDGSLQKTINGFWNPVAIAHQEKEIYVANENDGKIRVMDEDGNILKDYYVEKLNQIYLSVLDIEADEDNIYLSVVADTKESLSIYQIRKEDGEVSKIGESCMGILCRDSENRIYFAQTYEFIEGDGYTGYESGESSLYCISDGRMQEIVKFPEPYTPLDMVVYEGKLYIYSGSLAQVDVWDLQGNYEKTLLEESADSSNRGLGYMAADAEGNLYLSDEENHIVYKLEM